MCTAIGGIVIQTTNRKAFLAGGERERESLKEKRDRKSKIERRKERRR